jgi:competence protein ComEC
MIRWGLFPFARPAIACLLGIVLYEVGLRDWPPTVLATGSGALLSVVTTATLQRRLSAQARWTRTQIGAALLVTWGLIGAFWAGLWDESRRADHLLYQPQGIVAWEGVVEEGLTHKATYDGTTARVWQVKRADGHWVEATGRIKLLIRYGEQAPPRYGDVVLVHGAPQRVAPPPNPEQFDYATYLRHRQTWHEQFVSSVGYVVTRHVTLNPLKGWSLRSAEAIQQVLRRYVPAPREGGLLTALVLGITDDLATDLKTAYGATGTTHVLAVSGLHIGLVFSLVILLLGGDKWRKRHPAGRWLTLVLVLSICWGYALLTGLSASVLRAVVMATLVAVGRAGGKKISLFNTLAVAALGLLLYNPQYLFDVGFQLSFLAVLSIALLQPRLARWWEPEAWLPRQVWAGVTVALAAQAGTVPLTLYYFHQFPTQFLLANLVAVPWSNGLLYTSFGLLALAGSNHLLLQLGLSSAWLESALHGVGGALAWLTYWLNETVSAIGRLPAAVITGIHVGLGQMFLLYVILFTTVMWLVLRSRHWLVATVLTVALYVGSRIATLTRTATDHTFIVYSVRHHGAIGLLDGLETTMLTDSAIWIDSAAGPNGLRANILPHLGTRGAQRQTWHPWLGRDSLAHPPAGTVAWLLPDGNRLLAWRQVRVLLIDRPLALQPSAGARPIAVDWVLVHGRPRLKPSALARAVACRWVVLDGAGPAGWTKWRTQELRAAGFRCHSVAEEGAFIRTVN